MFLKVKNLLILTVALVFCLALAACSSGRSESGRVQSDPIIEADSPKNADKTPAQTTEAESVTPPTVLESAAVLSGYRAQAGDLDKPFVKFPNELYQYQASCYKIDTNTPFTGIAEIDEQIRNWADGQRNQAIRELDEACRFGSKDLFMQTSYETSVTRGQAIGMLFFVSRYTGGAHPINEVQTMNFSVRGGAPLQYEDVFVNTDGLYDFLSDYACRALRDKLGTFWDQGAVFADGLEAKAENFKNFVLTPDGLVLVFPQYQIAPYSEGVQSCLVPLESLVKFQPRPGIWQ